jgi:hypothetical protein
MIRPILYVNLPAVVFALDRRARSRGTELARFICAPEAAEPRAGLSALLDTLILINPSALTWICEDRWRLLGLAQAQRRGPSRAWDLCYLAAMRTGPDPSGYPSADAVLLELLEFVLNAALTRSIERVFATVDDDCPALEIFGRAGFQRYARELTYWLENPAAAAAAVDAVGRAGKRADAWLPANLALRRWHRHDTWGLLRLYDACTPRRVQVAECLTSEELLQTRAVGGRMWSLPVMETPVQCYVVDRGVRLGGWLRLRHGRGSQPHQLWLMVHPEDADLAGPLLRFGLRQFAAAQPRPVLCQVREYDGVAVEALRATGFEHVATRALLARHLLLRAFRQRTVPANESRVAYGVKGLGTAQSRMDRGGKTVYATPDH